jgi:hypothetical protein
MQLQICRATRTWDNIYVRELTSSGGDLIEYAWDKYQCSESRNSCTLDSLFLCVGTL